jgi:S1-C subfamily serine protease
VHTNDILVAINDRVVAGVDDVHRLLARMATDAACELTLIRGGKKITLGVKWP